VQIVATNLEIAIKTQLRAKVETSGSFTVPAKTLIDYIRLLSNDQVHVSIDGSEMIVKCGNSSTKIKGSPADEYPPVPDVDEAHAYVIEADVLRNALGHAVVAVAKNEIRPELSGVYAGFFTERHEGLVLAATDSYRLAEKKISVKQGTDVVQCIIPAKTIYEIARLVATSKDEEGSKHDVRLWVSTNQIAVRYDSFEMTSRLIDGTYPDYSQIIPNDFKTRAVCPVDVMVNKIKAASLFATTGVNAVSFDLNVSGNSIGVSSTSTQTGEHSSEIDAMVSGEENSILLNHRYVLDGLAHMSGDVEFCINGGDTPCLFHEVGNKDYLYIVMPIRQ